MNACAVRLRFVIVVLAWLAQALMPVVHAAAPKRWCGEHAFELPASAWLTVDLPAELDARGPAAQELSACAVAGSATAPAIHTTPLAVLRAVAPEPLPPSRPAARLKPPKPPAQAPPARG